MGTAEQIWSGSPKFEMELPQAMVECLGRPEIRFLDDKVVVVFKTNSQSGEGPASQLEYVFAWAFTGEGITELPKEEAVKLAEEKRKVCALKDGLIVDDETTIEQFDQMVAGVSIEDLECRTDYFAPWPVFCDYKGLYDYCPVARGAAGYMDVMY